jgi:hypothetical protein
MEQKEIVLGQVTYQIHRVYTGDRSPSELLAAWLVKKYAENSSFDDTTHRAV